MKTSYIKNIFPRAKTLKNIKSTAAALLAVLSTSAYAGVFGFEDVTETHEQTGDYYGNVASVSTSLGAYSGALNSLYYYNSQYDSYTAVGGVSKSTTKLTDYAHDMDSQAGGASSGSQYAVMYLPVANSTGLTQYLYEYGNSAGYPALTYATHVNGKNSAFDKVNDEGADLLPYVSFLMNGGGKVNFTSIDMSLTALTYEKLDSTGLNDSYMGNQTIHTKTDGVYVVRIYGVIDADLGLLTDTYVDWVAAKYIDGVNDILAAGWNNVSLENLFTEGGLAGLTFQVLSNFGNAYGIGVPTYIAMDNISFTPVPEPSTYAAILAVAALALAIRRRK